MPTSKRDIDGSAGAWDGGGIYMWEMTKRSGRIYYVPLDGALDPVADVALEDVQALDGSGNFVLGVGVMGEPGAGDVEPGALERLVVRAIEVILRDGDATTYQVYEALIIRFISSGLLHVLPAADVDVEGILRDNFLCYECLSPRGAVVRKWTLDGDRDIGYGWYGVGDVVEFVPPTRFEISNN